MVFCASANISQMRVLKTVGGPSSGITAFGGTVDARASKDGTDDLRDTREAVDVRRDRRPGILLVMSKETRCGAQ